jgi:hypothetical protein
MEPAFDVTVVFKSRVPLDKASDILEWPNATLLSDNATLHLPNVVSYQHDAAAGTYRLTSATSQTITFKTNTANEHLWVA